MAIAERQFIQGWGADLDRANRPAVPKEKRPLNGTGAHWEVLDRQTSPVKVFMSVERPQMTAAYGTTAPPRGLSGAIRSMAYQLAENRKARWMTLLLADRIDVVEGLLSDVARGHIPNIFAEMGLRAELRYNKKGFAK